MVNAREPKREVLGGLGDFALEGLGQIRLFLFAWGHLTSPSHTSEWAGRLSASAPPSATTGTYSAPHPSRPAWPWAENASGTSSDRPRRDRPCPPASPADP